MLLFCTNNNICLVCCNLHLEVRWFLQWWLSSRWYNLPAKFVPELVDLLRAQFTAVKTLMTGNGHSTLDQQFWFWIQSFCKITVFSRVMILLIPVKFNTSFNSFVCLSCCQSWTNNCKFQGFSRVALDPYVTVEAPTGIPSSAHHAALWHWTVQAESHRG